MKTYVGMNKIKGSSKSMDVSVIDGGYIQTYGGMVSIGYETGNRQQFALSVSISDILKAIETSKEESK